MKSIFKILILGVVPILMAAAVVDQGLAADKGSQLIFQSNMAHTNYISVANANDGRAVTVLVQYYNDEMERVLWYLRVIPGGGNFLVNPFDHMIPGSDPATSVGDFLTGLPAMSTEEDGPGRNSGHFAIAVTAVATSVDIADPTGDPVDAIDTRDERNQEETANVLFPTFLVDNEDLGIDLHGTDNIDNCGVLRLDNGEEVTGDDAATAAETNSLAYTEHGDDGVDDCSKGGDAGVDTTSKNVGDLNVDNAMPISFNHLSGNFTEALTSTPGGGADQTASWGGTPITRPAVDDTANMGLAVDVDDDAATNSDYQVLDGVDETDREPSATMSGLDGGRLAEKDAGGAEVANVTTPITRTGYTVIPDVNAIDPTEEVSNRGLNAGALVLPSLYGGSGEETHQIMLFLSVADNFGGPGKYELIAAKTGFDVTLHDNMGDMLENPATASGPVFGGADDPEPQAGIKIIVEGFRVMTDAGDCGGDMITGPWTLAHLTDIVPAAIHGGKKDFAGLGTMLDPMMNASPGLIKFKHSALKCKMDYGDGDIGNNEQVELPDGVPIKDERTYTGGTLIVEEKNSDRSFVVTGRVVLKFLTPASTFAASWSLKSPPSPAN